MIHNLNSLESGYMNYVSLDDHIIVIQSGGSQFCVRSGLWLIDGGFDTRTRRQLCLLSISSGPIPGW